MHGVPRTSAWRCAGIHRYSCRVRSALLTFPDGGVAGLVLSFAQKAIAIVYGIVWVVGTVGWSISGNAVLKST